MALVVGRWSAALAYQNTGKLHVLFPLIFVIFSDCPPKAGVSYRWRRPASGQQTYFHVLFLTKLNSKKLKNIFYLIWLIWYFLFNHLVKMFLLKYFQILRFSDSFLLLGPGALTDLARSGTQIWQNNRRKVSRWCNEFVYQWSHSLGRFWTKPILDLFIP